MKMSRIEHVEFGDFQAAAESVQGNELLGAVCQVAEPDQARDAVAYYCGREIPIGRKHGYNLHPKRLPIDCLRAVSAAYAVSGIPTGRVEDLGEKVYGSFFHTASALHLDRGDPPHNKKARPTPLVCQLTYDGATEVTIVALSEAELQAYFSPQAPNFPPLIDQHLVTADEIGCEERGPGQRFLPASAGQELGAVAVVNAGEVAIFSAATCLVTQRKGTAHQLIPAGKPLNKASSEGERLRGSCNIVVDHTEY